MKVTSVLVGTAALAAAAIVSGLAWKVRPRAPGLVGLVQGSPPKMDTGWVNRKWMDLPYGNHKSQKLDIYLPNTGKGPFPVIIGIHGGSFLMGDKTAGDLDALVAVLHREYALVSMNYRFGDEAVFPAQIHDVKAAIRYIRANAEAYHFDPNRIALWGSSAGGYLAALAGTSGDVESLEGLDIGNPRQSSRVQAVVDWFGPINFLTMEAQEKNTADAGITLGEIGKLVGSVVDRLLGESPAENPALARQANPETYITPDDPPFLIQHGTQDPLVPTQQSVDFALNLERVLGSDKVRLILLPGAKHGGPEFDSDENVKQVIDFLDRWMKQQPNQQSGGR